MTITDSNPAAIDSVLEESGRVSRLEAENARLRQELADLKTGEEQLRALVDNARDIVFQLSVKGVIEYVSPNVKSIYGYDPEDPVGQLFE